MIPALRLVPPGYTLVTLGERFFGGLTLCYDRAPRGAPYNPRKFELQLTEIAKQMVGKTPEIRAILLECTELPPHARAIQKAVGMPVGDSQAW
jgi:hypothetical protein